MEELMQLIANRKPTLDQCQVELEVLELKIKYAILLREKKALKIRELEVDIIGIDKVLEQYAKNVGECEKIIESIANSEGVEGMETSGEVS